jgi:hypothetical protein
VEDEVGRGNTCQYEGGAGSSAAGIKRWLPFLFVTTAPLAGFTWKISGHSAILSSLRMAMNAS